MTTPPTQRNRGRARLSCMANLLLRLHRRDRLTIVRGLKRWRLQPSRPNDVGCADVVCVVGWARVTHPTTQLSSATEGADGRQVERYRRLAVADVWHVNEGRVDRYLLEGCNDRLVVVHGDIERIGGATGVTAPADEAL